jgi:uncharacterized membrane protein
VTHGVDGERYGAPSGPGGGRAPALPIEELGAGQSVRPADDDIDQNGGVDRIELLPNCSLTVRGAVFFFATIAAASLTFAIYFAAQGLWPVLPFAGIELAALGWALWASMRRRHWTQTITITDDAIRIATRGPEGERRLVFSRHWASVRLRAPQGWHPSRLFIESHGRACEVGAFLT